MLLENRIKYIRKTMNLSQKQFATAIGIAQSTFAQFENGTREPKDIHIKQICFTYGISEQWLRFGTGDMQQRTAKDILAELKAEYKLNDFDSQLISEYARLPHEIRDIVRNYMERVVLGSVGVKGQPVLEDDISLNIDEIEKIPVKVFNQPAAAGFGNYLNDNGKDDYEIIDFPEAEVPYGVDFGIRISGNSMEPRIKDGSIIFVEALHQIQNGQVGIFIVEGEALCKELYINHAKKRVELVSWNKAYKNRIIGSEEEFRTVGKVVF